MKNYDYYSDPETCGRREVALIDMETHIRVITGVFDAAYGILEIDGEPPMSGVLVRNVENELLKSLARRILINNITGAVPKNKYHREIRTTDGYVDVYDVLVAFNVHCPAVQHGIKKLLCAGLRGKGSRLQDLTEARQAIDRAIELEK